jgi:hypothetical protein
MKAPSTEPTSTIPNPTPGTTATRPMGYVRVPELPDVPCPRCSAANYDSAVSVWRVADERGLHKECEGCGHSW